MSLCMVRRKMLNSLVIRTNPQDAEIPRERMLTKYMFVGQRCKCFNKKTSRSESEGFPSPPALLEYFFQGFKDCRMTWKGVIKPFESPGVPQPGLTHSGSRHFKIKSPTE